MLLLPLLSAPFIHFVRCLRRTSSKIPSPLPIALPLTIAHALTVQGKLPPNSLVRYRGMIQDQYEPEYFVGSFDQVEISTGQRSRVNVKYADSIPDRQGFVNTFDEAGAETMERWASSAHVVARYHTSRAPWHSFLFPAGKVLAYRYCDQRRNTHARASFIFQYHPAY